MEKPLSESQEKARKELLKAYKLPESATDSELNEAVGLETPTQEQFADLTHSQKAAKDQRPEVYARKEKGDGLPEPSKKTIAEVDAGVSDEIIKNLEHGQMYDDDKFLGYHRTPDGIVAMFRDALIGSIYRMDKQDMEERFKIDEKNFQNKKILENWPKE